MCLAHMFSVSICACVRMLLCECLRKREYARACVSDAHACVLLCEFLCGVHMCLYNWYVLLYFGTFTTCLFFDTFGSRKTQLIWKCGYRAHTPVSWTLHGRLHAYTV